MDGVAQEARAENIRVHYGPRLHPNNKVEQGLSMHSHLKLYTFESSEIVLSQSHSTESGS